MRKAQLIENLTKGDNKCLTTINVNVLSQFYTYDLSRRSNQNSRGCRYLLGGHKPNKVRLFEIWNVTG